MNEIKKITKTILSQIGVYDPCQTIKHLSEDGELLEETRTNKSGELIYKLKNEYISGLLKFTSIEHPMIFTKENIEYNYDPTGNLIQTVGYINDQKDITKERKYKLDGILQEEKWYDSNDNLIHQFICDSKGRVIKEIEPENYITAYHYDQSNKEKVTIHDNGTLVLEEKYEYDIYGNEVRSHGIDSETNEETIIEKRYNSNGKLLEEKQYLNKNMEFFKTYEYNEDNRMTHGIEGDVYSEMEGRENLEFKIEYEYYE